MNETEKEIKDHIELENTEQEVSKTLPNEPQEVVKLPRGLTRQQAIELLNNANCGD